ncbi:MAG TPA: AsmA-like C-terminal region-containing protein, partial [Chitinophagaceae bacterium]|nr:AsmA-like C-terminal region-containing protein [Chitinophagaceae bacterium]
APLLFKNQIVTKIKQEANKQLNATLNFDNHISLSFFRNFPHASLGVKDLSIVGKGEYAGDTLAYVGHLHVVIDLFSLFGGKTYQIRNVELDDPYIQLLVDSSGNANWDITIPDTSSVSGDTSSSFKAALQKYAVNDGRLIFSDASSGFYIAAVGLNHSGNGDFSQDVFDLSTHSEIKALTVAYGGIPYIDNTQTDIDADININLPQSKYTFGQSTIKLNDLLLGVDGYVSLPDSNDIAMDINFKANKADFKSFLSLIPAIYQKNFGKLKTSGTLAFNGFVKGIYNDHRIPSFELQLKVNKGMFQYPSMPEPLSDVNLDLALKNDDGDLDHTFINVRQLHFLMGSNPFDAHLTIQNPKSDPLVDGAVKGKVDLTEVSKIYPLEKGTKLSGKLNLDVQAKGRLSAVENKKYDQFNAKGQVLADNVVYSSSAWPEGVSIHQGQLAFSPQQVKVKDLSAGIGKSDIKADGQLDNLFGYLFGKDKLKGSLNVVSHLLNLNEMMGADTATTTTDTTSAVKAVVIPKNIDFNLLVNIGRFVYDSYDLRNVQGNVRVADGILTIKNVTANMLEGTAKLSGTYNTQNAKVPKTNLSLDVSHINIQKAFKTFNTVRALAPVAAFVQGNFSGNIDLSTLLTQELLPVLSSVNSKGKISIPDFNIKGFAPLQKLSTEIGIKQLQNLNINKVLLNFAVDSGYLHVRPFDFAVDSIKMTVAGRNGLNAAMDYNINMDIPRSKLGNVNSGLTNLIAQANKAAGTNVDLGDKINVGVHLGGTVTNPQVHLDLTKEKEQVTNALKATATQKLNQAKNKLLDQVFKGDTSKNDATSKPQQEKGNLKNKLKKGLNSLFNTKKDTAKKH